MKQNHTWKQLGMLIIFAMTLFTQTGCTDLQGAFAQSAAWREKAQAVESTLQTQLNDLESQRQQTQDSSPQASLLDAAIASASAKIQLLNTAIARADLVIEEAQNPTDSFTMAADAIAPWIPAPAQGPLVLGAALIATLFRSKNLKANTASIIQSIEHTLNRDPQFKQLFDQHADTIRTIQTPGARKLIDSTIRKSQKPSVLV
ncbi:MAG: hypothetical protein JKX70_04260 [Phycisphaerales bacterium]|nr:hypothetical protein [Phycisphaerales bacterium]